jgi:hypothetical protein
MFCTSAHFHLVWCNSAAKRGQSLLEIQGCNPKGGGLRCPVLYLKKNEAIFEFNFIIPACVLNVALIALNNLSIK